MEIPVGDGREKIRTLKARAVLVDMEEGVVNQVIKSPIGELFDDKQFVTDVSGAGNNWYVYCRRTWICVCFCSLLLCCVMCRRACGYHMYGNMYGKCRSTPSLFCTYS